MALTINIDHDPQMQRGCVWSLEKYPYAAEVAVRRKPNSEGRAGRREEITWTVKPGRVVILRSHPDRSHVWAIPVKRLVPGDLARYRSQGLYHFLVETIDPVDFEAGMELQDPAVVPECDQDYGGWDQASSLQVDMLHSLPTWCFEGDRGKYRGRLPKKVVERVDARVKHIAGLGEY